LECKKFKKLLKKLQDSGAMMSSSLHQRVICEAIDHAAWTATPLCENWWSRL